MTNAPLPYSARAFITGVAGAALVVVLWAGYNIAGGTGPTIDLVALGLMVLASNRFPLLIYGRDYSEAVGFDEGLIAVVIATLPTAAAILLYAVVELGAQVWRGRSPLKALFNASQFTLSATAAIFVADAIGRSPDRVTATLAPAMLAGVATYILVNAALLGTLLNRVVGQPVLAVWRQGLATRLLLVAVGATTGMLAGLAVASDKWALLAVPVIFLLLRQVLAGHFDARRDRDRVLGLLDGTREIHSAMGDRQVPAAVERVASKLLRGTARVVPHQASGLAAEIPDHQQWVVVTGREPGEPFDHADVQLLHTIGAVAAGALTNAALYTEVHAQRLAMETILGALAEGVCAFDAHGCPTFWNAAAERMLGLTTETFSTVHPAAETLLAPVRRCLQSGSTLANSMTLLDGDGRPLPVTFTCAPMHENGQLTGAVLAFRDDTERLDFEAQLSHNAFHDQLTGLANRRLFLDRVDQALRRAERHAGLAAVLVVDIDRFKLVNDSLGHQAGDRLLREIAARLTAVVRDGDTVARFGGDEFTLLLEDVTDAIEVHQVAERIAERMKSPIEVAAHRTVVTTLSIGVAISRPEASGDDLLHDADLAMYEAKAEGLGRWKQFAGGSSRSLSQLELEEDLRLAIASDSIDVYFQPMVDAGDGVAVEAEALVRWNHPRRGMISPAEFIPLAEETGLVLPLGRLVLREACRQCKSWETDHGVQIGVSVNLSARQFQDDDLVDEVQRALESAGLPAERLCLEITETLAMRETEWTIQTLQRLKDIGVRVAIDDFGTGHSSLNYLKRFPIDIVKIDGTFVSDITTSVVDNAIITAVVTLAKTLGITTVAECVEDPEQLGELRELGCTLIQGFLFARPMPATELREWIAAEAKSRGLRIPRPRRPDSRLPVATS